MKNTTPYFFSVFLLLTLMLSSCGSETAEGTSTDSPNTGSTPKAGGTYDLSVRPIPGAPIIWKVSWNDETVTQIPDQQRGQGWNDVLDATGFALTLESIPEEITPEGTAKVAATVLEVSSYYNSEEQNYKYDSNTPGQEDQSMGYHHFLNRNLRFDLEKTGNISNLEGGKEIFANFGDPQLMNVGNTYTAEILDAYSYFLPGKKVAVGESWQVTHQYTAGTGLIMDLTLTLNGVSEGLAEIAIASKVRPNPNAVPTLMGEASFTYDLAGDGSGTVSINLETGLPTYLLHTFHLTGHTLFTLPNEPEPKKYFTTKTFYYELKSN